MYVVTKRSTIIQHCWAHSILYLLNHYCMIFCCLFCGFFFRTPICSIKIDLFIYIHFCFSSYTCDSFQWATIFFLDHFVLHVERVFCIDVYKNCKYLPLLFCSLKLLLVFANIAYDQWEVEMKNIETINIKYAFCKVIIEFIVYGLNLTFCWTFSAIKILKHQATHFEPRNTVAVIQTFAEVEFFSHLLLIFSNNPNGFHTHHYE